MSILNENYGELSRDQYGLAIIEVTGRCTDDECTAIEAGCTWKYRMEEIPNSSGAVLKSLDGTSPTTVVVTHPTTG